MAAEGGAAASVATLVAAGANVEARDSFGRSPLYAAGVAGRVDAVAALLAAGADANATDADGRGVFWAACAARQLETAVALADGADVDAPDARGVTPLQHAIACGHAEVVEFLHASGAKDDFAGRLSSPEPRPSASGPDSGEEPLSAL